MGDVHRFSTLMFAMDSLNVVELPFMLVKACITAERMSSHWTCARHMGKGGCFHGVTPKWLVYSAKTH